MKNCFLSLLFLAGASFGANFDEHTPIFQCQSLDTELPSYALTLKTYTEDQYKLEIVKTLDSAGTTREWTEATATDTLVLKDETVHLVFDMGQENSLVLTLLADETLYGTLNLNGVKDIPIACTGIDE